MNRTKILVTGKNGQVGYELSRTLAPFGELMGVDVEDCDLTDPDAIRNLIRGFEPQLIVNPAAYTAVDRAESEPELAKAINTTAPGIIAEEAKRLGALMIHYSTDYVFDGNSDAPYGETDAPNPTSVYGKTKLDGESAVRDSGATHLIFRLSWVYGLRGANFLLTMQRLAREREELNIVNDQFGGPTWCRMIAEATAAVVSRHLQRPIQKSGTYHMSAAGKTSWYDFAKAIFDLSPQKHDFKLKTVNAIPTTAYPTPATRPHFSVLSNALLSDTFGVALPPWEEQLKLALEG
ncbi:MAG: dTDP-4-dehydrorhamnose reductase [Deltaproteobacteria bacterium]|nr:dTDP-4-dehydrorhamnose reductase [Deltaproteobacteria bacterium]MBN2674444.1 dTDP-4-dehydrorhamnose reductase [Deltaproteobacteria bacterium]